MFTVILKPKHGTTLWQDYHSFHEAILAAKRRSKDEGLSAITIRHDRENIFTWRLQCIR